MVEGFHFLRFLNAEHDAHHIGNPHQHHHQHDKHAGCQQRFMCQQRKASQVVLTHHHAANGKEGLHHAVDKYDRHQEHLQADGPEEKTTVGLGIKNDIVDEK